jgi:hypothetical protein
MIKRLEEDSSNLFELEGSNTLGSLYHIIPRVDGAPNITNCPVQWYRIVPGGIRELISGMLPENKTELSYFFQGHPKNHTHDLQTIFIILLVS